jgi:hypothetical protein
MVPQPSAPGINELNWKEDFLEGDKQRSARKAFDPRAGSDSKGSYALASRPFISAK